MTRCAWARLGEPAEAGHPRRITDLCLFEDGSLAIAIAEAKAFQFKPENTEEILHGFRALGAIPEEIEPEYLYPLTHVIIFEPHTH